MNGGAVVTSAERGPQCSRLICQAQYSNALERAAFPAKAALLAGGAGPKEDGPEPGAGSGP